MPGRISVVIASYNVREHLRECLRSVLASEGVGDVEVIVVDNDSRDGSVEMAESEFPTVRVIRNDSNVGFARANNRALSETSGDYILVLNPDTRLEPDTLAALSRVMDERPEVGICGVRLVREDGSLDRACRRSFPTPLSALARFLLLDRLFPNSRLLGRYNVTWRDPESDYEVDAVVGAFMFLRRAVIDDVGPLDESFFMFGEDLDWCYRAKDRGWRVLYVGSISAFHAKGAATRQQPARMNFHFHRAMMIFHKKHLDRHYPFFVNWLVSAGIGVRWGIKSLLLLVKGRPQPTASEVDGR